MYRTTIHLQSWLFTGFEYYLMGGTPESAGFLVPLPHFFFVVVVVYLLYVENFCFCIDFIVLLSMCVNISK